MCPIQPNLSCENFLKKPLPFLKNDARGLVSPREFVAAMAEMTRPIFRPS
jgi:hypothetical protein